LHNVAITSVCETAKRGGHIIHLFGRDEELQRRHIKVGSFRPYFYIREVDIDNIVIDPRIMKISTGDFTAYLTNDKLAKIESYSQDNIDILEKSIRFMGVRTWENKVPVVDRFRIDSGIKSGIRIVENNFEPMDILDPRYRLQIIDVEVNAGRKVPNPTNAPVKLLCMTVFDSFEQKIYVLYVGDFDVGDIQSRIYPLICEQLKDSIENDNEDKGYIRPEDFTFKYTLEVINFNDEEDLLWWYISYTNRTDPDYIGGFNTKWDLKYILGRCKKKNIEYKLLSPIGEIVRHKRYLEIKGREIYDVRGSYLLTKQKELPEYTLNYICLNELGVGQLKFNGTFRDKWKSNPIEVVDRNYWDVYLTVWLSDYLDLLEQWLSVSREVGCSLGQVNSRSKMIDIVMLREYFGKEVLPSIVSEEIKVMPGAKVIDIVPGLHRNVFRLDFSALYPNIIRYMNISPDSMDPEGTIQIMPAVRFLDPSIRMGKVPSIMEKMMPLREKLREEVNKLGTIIQDTDDEVLKHQLKNKQKILDYRQKSLKVIINAIYGQLNFKSFRFHSSKCLEAVTYVGRKLLDFIAEEIDKLGYKVLAGDTDSVMVTVDKLDITRDELVAIAKDVEKKMQIKIPGFAKRTFGVNNFPLEIKLELVCDTALFVEKKNYAMHYFWKASDGGYVDVPEGKKDNRFEFKGLGMVRSDTAVVSKKVMETVIKWVLEGKDREDIIKYVRGVIDNIHNYSLEEIGIPTRIKKDLKEYAESHMTRKSANYSNKYFKTYYNKGSKPKRLYINAVPSGYPFIKILFFDDSFDLPGGFKVDYNMFIDRGIRKKLEKILNVVGIHWNEINMLTLGDFCT